MFPMRDYPLRLGKDEARTRRAAPRCVRRAPEASAPPSNIAPGARDRRGLDRGEAVLRMVLQILERAQAAIGDAGTLEACDDRGGRRGAEHRGDDVVERRPIG